MVPMADVQVQAWHKSQMRQKPQKVVVRLRNQDGSFLDSVNVPSVMWPLNAPYEVFNCYNCTQISEQEVAVIVNALPYETGCCYSNTERVVKALQQHGYDVKQYCGWLFIGPNFHPIHHSWAVLNGCHVIDLADDYTLLDHNYSQYKSLTGDALRHLMVDFAKWARQFPHSMRCYPFGVPATRLLYIGCPCSKLEGIRIYNNLCDVYPNHPCCSRTRPSGMTRLQEMMKAEGIK